MPVLMHGVVRWMCARVLPAWAYPVLRGPLKGARFILGAAAGGGGGASVYVDRVEPAKTQALLSILRPGQVVFDIGANVGYYTVLASRRIGSSGRVVACEPFVRNIAYLHRHIQLNRADNVTIIPAACAERAGVGRFVQGTDCAEGHLVAGSSSDARGIDYVATITVDQIVRESGLAPDLLKVDVEGAEEHVLRGAFETLSSARPIVLLGVHSSALRAACTTLLTAHGYGQPTVCGEVGGDTELLFVPLDGPPSVRLPQPPRS
jgi:FkbM family methyltransferase